MIALFAGVNLAVPAIAEIVAAVPEDDSRFRRRPAPAALTLKSFGATPPRSNPLRELRIAVLIEIEDTIAARRALTGIIALIGLAGTVVLTLLIKSWTGAAIAARLDCPALALEAVLPGTAAGVSLAFFAGSPLPVSTNALNGTLAESAEWLIRGTGTARIAALLAGIGLPVPTSAGVYIHAFAGGTGPIRGARAQPRFAALLACIGLAVAAECDC